MTVYQTFRCIYPTRSTIGLTPTQDKAAFYANAAQTPAIAFRDRRREVHDGAT